jgi:hypothetical protein
MWCRSLIYDRIGYWFCRKMMNWYSRKLDNITDTEVNLVRKRDTYAELC